MFYSYSIDYLVKRTPLYFWMHFEVSIFEVFYFSVLENFKIYFSILKQNKNSKHSLI